MREDEGYLQDIHRFPIKTLEFGDTGGVYEYMYYTLGPLKCIMGTTSSPNNKHEATKPCFI